MKKNLTFCCSHISAQERARKGHKEHRANNEWLEETDHTAESPLFFTVCNNLHSECPWLPAFHKNIN